MKTKVKSQWSQKNVRGFRIHNCNCGSPVCSVIFETINTFPSKVKLRYDCCKEPTRMDIISGIETLLDPVLVSDDCDCRFVEVIDIDKTISDHKATKLYLKIPDVIHKSYQRLVWIYKKGDFVKFNNLISQFDWYMLLSNCTQNISMMCVRFTENI